MACIAPALRHSRFTLGLIRQNITVAVGLKAVFLVLALIGKASLWLAVAADMGASLLVIANGMRALSTRSHAGVSR